VKSNLSNNCLMISKMKIKILKKFLKFFTIKVLLKKEIGVKNKNKK